MATEPKTKNQPEPTNAGGQRGEPANVDERIARILTRAADTPFLNPWRDRLLQRQRQPVWEKLVREAGVRYRNCTLATYRVEEETIPEGENRPSQRLAFDKFRAHVELMPDWITNGQGMILHGRPGTGKDHLVMAAAYEAVLMHGWEVVLVSGLNLYQRARDLIRDGRGEMEFINDYREPRILILSDPVPPRGEASNYNTDVLYRILDRRYRDMKSTWITINCIDGEEAEKRMAGSLIDRMKDGALVMECNWPSYRKPRV